MIRALLVAFGCLIAGDSLADTVVAARTIRAQEVIAPEDLLLRDVDLVGGIADPNQIIGKEARVALYAGRPIRPGDIGAPSVVDRNEIIPLIFTSGGLVITTEGRALGRAGPGEVIRVMNLSSRNTVTARVDANGAAHVSR